MIPHTVNYNVDPPVAIPHKQRHYRQLPTALPATTASTNDVIRFVVARDNVWWDPYSSYIKLTIQATFPKLTSTTDTCVQVDGSAHSFISSLVLRERDIEIERIDNYDVIANIINDMNQGVPVRTNKDYMGIGGITSPGYSSSFVNQNNITSGSVAQFFRPDQNRVTGAAFPTIPATLTYLDGINHFAPQLDNSNGGTEETGRVAPNISNQAAVTIPTAGTEGFGDIYPESFCASVHEPVFSGNMRIRIIENGDVVVKTGVTTHTFYIPLVSGILGILKPPSQYKLIPLKAFQNLVVEIRMNPHALFSSNILQSGETNELHRGYTVSEIELNAEIFESDDQELNDALERLLQGDGLNIFGTSYFSGLRSTFVNATIPTTIQLSTGFGSLKSQIVCFLDELYKTQPYARKQYRLSHNITSLQMRIGTDYYPPQPITGNGGTNFGAVTNIEFYWHLCRAFNKIISNTAYAINPHNFSVNFRQISSSQVPTNAITDTKKLQIFYENRCIGKAVYAVDLDSGNYDNGLLGGVDTRFMLPYQILLANQNDAFVGNTEVYTFAYYDLLVTLSYAAVNVKGKN